MSAARASDRSPKKSRGCAEGAPPGGTNRPEAGHDPDSARDLATPLAEAEAKRLFAGLEDEPALVVAVSGGPDSTALLWLTARWAKRLKKRPKLLAATIDHGLRPQARLEALAVKRLARTLGVPHRTLRWTGEKPTTGVQAKARAERYRLLEQVARRTKARCILTAHTLDDQAETVFIRMARGSGITGLAAMSRITPWGLFFVARPLLDVPKARLIATLREQEIPFAEDPSNADPRFTRARLRGLMPSLAREGLDARRLALLARRLRRADAAIEASTDAAVVRLTLPQPPQVRDTRRRKAESHGTCPPWPTIGPIEFDREGFSVLPEEVALRLLGRALTRVGDEGPVELKKLEVLTGDLRVAMAGEGGRARFRRTLAGALVTLGVRLRIERAPSRRRPPERRHSPNGGGR